MNAMVLVAVLVLLFVAVLSFSLVVGNRFKLPLLIEAGLSLISLSSASAVIRIFERLGHGVVWDIDALACLSAMAAGVGLILVSAFVRVRTEKVAVMRRQSDFMGLPDK